MSQCPSHLEIRDAIATPTDHPFLFVQESAALQHYGLRRGDSLLQLDCGHGAFLGWMADLLGEGTTVGIEADPASLERARQQTQVGRRNLALLQADGVRTGLETGSFDCVYHRLPSQPMSRTRAVLTEARRLTRRGGIVAISATDIDWVAAADCPALEVIIERAKPVLEARGVELHAGRRLAALMDHAGVVSVDLQTFSVSSREVGAAEWIDIFVEPWLSCLPSDEASFLADRLLCELSSGPAIAVAAVFIAIGRA